MLSEKQRIQDETIISLLHLMMSPEGEQEKNTDQGEREDACSVLVEICQRHPRKFYDLILHEDAEVAAGAAQILGRSRRKQSLQALILSLNNVRPPVLNSVIWAIGQFKNPDAVNKLSEFMHYEAADVREATIGAISNISGDETFSLLISALTDSAANVRWVAAEAFTRREVTESDVEKLIAPLIFTLKDHDEHVRSQSANALGYLYDDRAVPPLLIALKDESDEVRSFAVKSLGQIGSSNAFHPVVECLNDKSWVVRSGAAEALIALGDDHAIPFLRSRIKDESDFVRKEIRKAIKSLQS